MLADEKGGNGSDQPSELRSGFSEGQAVCSPPPSAVRRFPPPKALDPNRKEGEERPGSDCLAARTSLTGSKLYRMKGSMARIRAALPSSVMTVWCRGPSESI